MNRIIIDNETSIYTTPSPDVVYAVKHYKGSFYIRRCEAGQPHKCFQACEDINQVEEVIEKHMQYFPNTRGK